MFEAGLARKFNRHGSVTPSLSARIGWSEGDEKNGGIDYGYWNAGVSFLFADYFEFDIRYFDTFDDAVVGRQLHRPLRWARRGPHHVRELSQELQPRRGEPRRGSKSDGSRWRYVAIAGSARGWATGAATPMRRTEIGALSMGSEGIPAQRLSAGSVSPFISSENWPRLAPRLISVS